MKPEHKKTPKKKATQIAPVKPERIVVDNPIHKKVRIVSNPEEMERKHIAQAESAIEDLSAQFDTWLNSDLLKLVEAKQKVVEHGLTDTTRQEIYLASHELKGLGTTFGFPLVSKLAFSLCALLESIKDNEKIPISVLEQHVDAIAAIVNEDARNQGSVIARTLVDKLCAVTSDFINEITKPT